MTDTRVSRSSSPVVPYKYSLDYLSSDVIRNILGYLLPRDLSRCLYLSSYHRKLAQGYVGTDYLERVCPKCGNDWISTSPIDTEFNDIDEEDNYFDVRERRDYVTRVFPSSQATRKHLLCDECENDIQECTSLTHFVLNHTKYQLYVNLFSRYPWACLVKQDTTTVIWNQYRCVIPMLAGYGYQSYDDDDFDYGENDEEGEANYDYDYAYGYGEEGEGGEEEEDEENYSDPEYEYNPEDWAS